MPTEIELYYDSKGFVTHRVIRAIEREKGIWECLISIDGELEYFYC